MSVPQDAGAVPPAEIRPHAVVDVNVLVSAARSPNGLCRRLLEDAIDGRWRPVVSALLFEELEDVLARLAFRDVLGQEAIDRFLADLLAVVEWAEDPEGPPIVATRDPDDDYPRARSRGERRRARLRRP
jgi:predicted nucleic acid-binding protein